ncbi:MAG: hypothetical protein PUH24_09750 [Prevotellaceae bacterium]|nr:hypothetical protein [Prevotella sp.]MDD7258530.1 hypothetical protein [Prevotellaceae bacterium]MDY6131525.1 hypothetical protein [Prevotella sp.]
MSSEAKEWWAEGQSIIRWTAADGWLRARVPAVGTQGIIGWRGRDNLLRTVK